MSFPSKTKQIEIRKNVYTVTFPNNRQFLNINSRKAQLSREMYDALSYSADGNSRYASLLIDAIATLEAILPDQFSKDLNIVSILEGDILVGAELVKVYQHQVQAWFQEWEAAIAEVLNPKVAEEVSKEA